MILHDPEASQPPHVPYSSPSRSTRKQELKKYMAKCLCVSERPYKIYHPCFRVLLEGDEYERPARERFSAPSILPAVIGVPSSQYRSNFTIPSCPPLLTASTSCAPPVRSGWSGLISFRPNSCFTHIVPASGSPPQRCEVFA